MESMTFFEELFLFACGLGLYDKDAHQNRSPKPQKARKGKAKAGNDKARRYPSWARRQAFKRRETARQGVAYSSSRDQKEDKARKLRAEDIKWQKIQLLAEMEKEEKWNFVEALQEYLDGSIREELHLDHEFPVELNEEQLDSVLEWVNAEHWRSIYPRENRVPWGSLENDLETICWIFQKQLERAVSGETAYEYDWELSLEEALARKLARDNLLW